MTKIPVRELKAKTSKLLREVSQEGKQFVITRHGHSCAKLVPIKEEEYQTEKAKKKSLRGYFSQFPELSDSDFSEAKKIWPLT